MTIPRSRYIPTTVEDASFEYDGINDHWVNFAFLSGRPLTLQPAIPFTMAFWLKLDTLPTSPADRCIISRWKELGINSEGYKLVVVSTGQVQFFLQKHILQGINLASGVGDMTTGTWEHWALTYDGSNGPTPDGGLYKNGERVSTWGTVGTPLPAIAYGANSLRIGARNSGNGDGMGQASFWDGRMQDFKFFKRFFPQIEMQHLYNSADVRSSSFTNENSMGPHATFTGLATFLGVKVPSNKPDHHWDFNSLLTLFIEQGAPGFNVDPDAPGVND